MGGKGEKGEGNNGDAGCANKVALLTDVTAVHTRSWKQFLQLNSERWCRH